MKKKEMIAKNGELGKTLLSLEVFICLLSCICMFGLIMIAAWVPLNNIIRMTLMGVSFVPFIIACYYAIKIEQLVGYYQCGNCGHEYIPSFKAVLWAMHIGRTRYMKCPECGEKTWQKKV